VGRPAGAGGRKKSLNCLIVVAQLSPRAADSPGTSQTESAGRPEAAPSAQLGAPLHIISLAARR